MEVKPIITKFLTNVAGAMHKGTMKALAVCIESAMNGNSLTVTSIGRGIGGDAYEKHGIKRCDRLCSNRSLINGMTGIYGKICKQWVSSSSRPVILVDWSDLDDCKNAFLISATLVCDGRPITLYSQTHPLGTKEKPGVHQHFLETLKTLLPENCHPIIVADAGFQVPWHELVLSLDWDYVGRVRKPNCCKLNDDDGDTAWLHADEVFKKATSTAKCYKGLLTISNAFETTFILYKGPAKGRHKKTTEGKRCQSKHSEQHAKSGKEPWVLVTSLPLNSTLAKRAVKIYKSRMQIEESYRDIKSSRFGLGFENSKSYTIKRIAVLILIGVLASLMLIMIGAAAEQADYAKHFQANTIKDRRVLSFHFLGLRMITQTRLVLTREHFVMGIQYMKSQIAEAEYGLKKFS